MATTIVRQRTHAKRLLDQLPVPKLGIALTFLRYLEVEESWDATREILGDDRAMRQVRKSRRAWKQGNRRAFVRLEPSAI